jgi:hypothetical protein
MGRRDERCRVRQVPQRRDSVRFVVGDREIAVAFLVALELAERAARTHDADIRAVGARIRGAGASSPVVLSVSESTALARVIDEWELDATTVRSLRSHLTG